MTMQTEEIMGIRIDYDPFVKKEINECGLWMPFTHHIAGIILRFLNDNFYSERQTPELSVWLGYDNTTYTRDIELQVRIKDTPYGEGELFTMEVFVRSYAGKDAMREFTNHFFERFQSNIVRHAVMEKIELYRNPPKPKVDWRLTDLAGLTLARTAIGLSIVFVIMVIIYIVYVITLTS